MFAIILTRTLFCLGLRKPSLCVFCLQDTHLKENLQGFFFFSILCSSLLYYLWEWKKKKERNCKNLRKKWSKSEVLPVEKIDPYLVVFISSDVDNLIWLSLSTNGLFPISAEKNWSNVSVRYSRRNKISAYADATVGLRCFKRIKCTGLRNLMTT